MNYLILVNKENYLEKNYKPKGLVKLKTKLNKDIYLEKKAYKNITKLLKKANLIFDTEFIVASGYRDYFYQQKLFDKDLNLKGSIDEVNKTLALPGQSEHQTGLAVYIGFIKEGLYDSEYEITDYLEEFKWLEENSSKYGFILRYPKGKENITGYSYEPWHLRYVGKVAKFLYLKKLTLEEYLNCDIVM